MIFMTLLSYLNSFLMQNFFTCNFSYFILKNLFTSFLTYYILNLIKKSIYNFLIIESIFHFQNFTPLLHLQTPPLSYLLSLHFSTFYVYSPISLRKVSHLHQFMLSISVKTTFNLCHYLVYFYLIK